MLADRWTKTPRSVLDRPSPAAIAVMLSAAARNLPAMQHAAKRIALTASPRCESPVPRQNAAPQPAIARYGLPADALARPDVLSPYRRTAFPSAGFQPATAGALNELALRSWLPAHPIHRVSQRRQVSAASA